MTTQPVGEADDLIVARGEASVASESNANRWPLNPVGEADDMIVAGGEASVASESNANTWPLNPVGEADDMIVAQGEASVASETLGSVNSFFLWAASTNPGPTFPSL